MSDREIRQLAALMREPSNRLWLRQGTVASNNGDGTYQVTLGGDDEEFTAQLLAGAAVTVGGTVYVLKQGAMVLALGGNAT